ncbi:YwiC-like family protein [Macrococcus armenti]|uniref:YwiC-like family protein n=1 Tax=Macrococcus armenti TaxID=2875764 RepID=UPI001CCEE27A|nr:YwiC-like family protein [Macrococcus armenti]UBH09128.1 YwiC-like family protein [Macrococcus armenti]UBH11423.1 YwiC-like family protein [Macrococcus armenti]UBH15904.1 YwiC-like family protein [Macrococcus armenti]UBH18265.1 YwiC-like family protein [Macrococcus armenti]UBH20530.1 YwiC-like family protein [Macrococcus armenti]
MKFKKPNQHGAWAMIIMPVLFGMFATKFNIFQLLFFAGWFMTFFFADHFLFYVKQRKKQIGYLKCALLFLLIAVICYIPIIIYEYKVMMFFLAMVPFGIINYFFAKARNERHIVNDFSAVIIFSIAGVLTYYIQSHQFEWTMTYVFGLSVVYFIGTVFYVKTMIREKRNIHYRNMSWIYHALLVIVGYFIHPLVFIAFLPSLIRSVMLYGKQLKPIKIGVLEIANAVFITVFIGLFFNIIT